MLVLFDGNRGALLALVPPTFLPKYMNTNNNSTRVVIVWGVTKCLLVHIRSQGTCIYLGGPLLGPDPTALDDRPLF